MSIHQEVTDQLNEIVRRLIDEHTGGVPFFDALDEEIRAEGFMAVLSEMAEVCFTQGIDLVVSGKFGRYFANADIYPGERLLVVNGGLRHGEIMDLTPFKWRIRGVDYVFLDDSFFQGRTRNKIRAEIERLGGKLLHTFVVYDGSQEHDDDVTSLYRYWDYVN